MGRQRKRKGDPVHGWLAVDKPVGVTSTQVVSRLKRLFNAQKVGHGGTLDPLASGILPIAFGEATKTVQWAMDSDKAYEFTIRWGSSTVTLDAEGEVIARSHTRPSQEDIEAALPGFIGEIEQVPPKYSAIKVDGERAYDLAREGENFELETRCVTVLEATLIDCPDQDHATLRIVSGKGFYVRAMARDLTRVLGVEGHVSYLRRIRVGQMKKDAAYTLEHLEALAEDKIALLGKLQPIALMLNRLPKIEITSDQAKDVRLGRSILLLPHTLEAWEATRDPQSADWVTFAACKGDTVAIGEVRAGSFQPSRVFQLQD